MTDLVPFHDAPHLGAVTWQIIQGLMPTFGDYVAFTSFPELSTLLQECWNTEPKERPMVEAFLQPLRAAVSQNHVATSGCLKPSFYLTVD